MSFEEGLERADSEFDQGYRDLLVSAYGSLFDAIKQVAVPHMQTHNCTIPFDVKHRNPYLNVDGKFYADSTFPGQPPEEVNIIEIAEIYQRDSDNLAAQADARGHHTLDLRTAMRSALEDLRESTRESLASII